MDQIIVDITSMAIVAIAVFGILFSLIQTRHSHVSHSFAMFLAAIAVNTLPDAFAQIFQTLPTSIVQTLELIIWLPSGLCLAPLFWLYVFTLTSPTQQRPARLYRHFLLPWLAVLLGGFLAFAAPKTTALIFVQQPLADSPDGSLILLVAFSLLHLSVTPQIAVYLLLIMRRLMQHRILLRDVYASTEEHELRWIYVIGSLSVLFWCGSALIQLLVIDPQNAKALSIVMGLSSLCGLAMVTATTLWGLRQRPPLVPDMGADETEVTDAPHDQRGEKYEKSALSKEAALRIAGKLRAAMEQDHLHRDPNLSLWTLTRHVGASSNYISQTLSEVIGESFFDFVNGYRIAEAKTLLATTNETVLTITYEVGFNARSSFYNAFKRVTGQTPTSYRKTLSRPVGVDDTDNGMRKT